MAALGLGLGRGNGTAKAAMVPAARFDAVLGNGAVLACFGRSGDLLSLTFPTIDGPNHAGAHDLRVAGHSLFRLEVPHERRWLGGSDVLERTYALPGGGRVRLTDAVHPELRVLVRRLRASALVDVERLEEFHLGESTRHDAAFVAGDVTFAYRDQHWVGLAADRPPDEAAVRRARGQSAPAEQRGDPLWRRIEAGNMLVRQVWRGVRELELRYGFGGSWAEAGRLTRTEGVIKQALAAARRFGLGRDWDGPTRRSAYLLRALADREHGGILAAPEFDPDYAESGGYAYCWARDAAFVTQAMDVLGLTEQTRRFYLRWAPRAQEPDGVFLHRHRVDGTLGPSWGLVQLDETGSILVGARHHARGVPEGDTFAAAFYATVGQHAARYLAASLGDDNLPPPCVDLWEERTGQHTYSIAAVAEGLDAARWLALRANHPDEAGTWGRAARRVRAALLNRIRPTSPDRLLRTLAPSPRSSPPDPRYPIPADGRLDEQANHAADVSLLGLAYPFGVVGAGDPWVTRALRTIYQRLRGPCGIHRYEGDLYHGGNAWVLATLWVAIVHAQRSELPQAESLYREALGQATDLGLLPEQVLPGGLPGPVHPLGWSQAMQVLGWEALEAVRSAGSWRAGRGRRAKVPVGR